VSDLPPIPVRIRSFEPRDAAVCRDLFAEGRLDGLLAENDTGLDIDCIADSYMKDPGSHFFVAESEQGEVVGMIGVMRQESGVGEIRRLRVRTDARRRGIGAKLLEAAVAFCKEKQYLKIRLDTYMDREPAIHLFEKFKFRHSRTRDLHGKQLLYFYLDLYSNELPAARRRE
jgi:ribosomal protein S18 acetylase RimI-like enzyme